MTASELKVHFKKQLEAFYSPEEINNFYFQVLSHLLQKPKLQILSQLDKEIDEKVKQRVQIITGKLEKKEPLQYILGEVMFYDLLLKVSPAVLIPRPETEELVDWIIKDYKGKGVNILDVCTGSGCIALALKQNLPKANATAMDISAEALEIAHKNAVNLNININIIQADALNIKLNSSDYEVIVSNPPYVLPEEKQTMDDNVLLYEPHQALFVPENDPLVFYKSIANFAKSAKHDVTLYFEINETKADELITLFKELGLSGIEVRKDINGKNRMLKCIYIC